MSTADGADPGHDLGGVTGVARRHETDIGYRPDQSVGRVSVRQGGHDRLALRRPGSDRRALDAEVVAGEVDVMQLAAVDEPAAGDVADLGVIFPAVPQPPDHLDVVGRLIEQPGHQLPRRRSVPVRQRDPREDPAAEVSGLIRAGRYAHPDAGPAVADVIERRDGLGEVERLGVRDDHGRDQPDVPGQRGRPGGDEHRVQAPGDPVGPGGLQREAVFDGDEVEQASFGLGDDIGPVAAGEQLGRARARLAPRGGMPARAIERDGQVHGRSLRSVREHGFRKKSPIEIGVLEIRRGSAVLFRFRPAPGGCGPDKMYSKSI